jgi:hypothetical protein
MKRITLIIDAPRYKVLSKSSGRGLEELTEASWSIANQYLPPSPGLLSAD